MKKNVKDLKNNYAVVDMQDLLAMTALEYATDSVTKNSSVEIDNLSKEIFKLRDDLDI